VGDHDEVGRRPAPHNVTAFLREGFPVNVLNQVKQVPEVCRIFCANRKKAVPLTARQFACLESFVARIPKRTNDLPADGLTVGWPPTASDSAGQEVPSEPEPDNERDHFADRPAAGGSEGFVEGWQGEPSGAGQHLQGGGDGQD